MEMTSRGTNIRLPMMITCLLWRSGTRTRRRGWYKGIELDVNHMSSAQGRKNGVSWLLTNAIVKDSEKDVHVFYIKNGASYSLYNETGLTMANLPIQEGLRHSIHDAGSPVNRFFIEQTDTEQFGKWFKGSNHIKALKICNN